jgi:hypothetical protein
MRSMHPRRHRLLHDLRRRRPVVIGLLTAGAFATSAIGDATLVHHWPGEGTAEDAVGRADGTAIGAMTYDAGRVGRAFRFADGSAVALPASVGDAINGDFTIASWCRFESPAAAALLHHGSSCAAGEWFRMESRPDGDLLVSCSDDETGTLALLTRKADLLDGAWHHVAWRREGNAHSLFVDGCLLVSPTLSDVGSLAIPTDLLLGGAWCTSSGDAGAPFAGWIDEVRWYLGALDDGAIRSLARGPVAADLTGDNAVDGADLALLFSSWGSCGACCAADLDGDGEVDGADLGALLAQWTAR